MSGDAAGRSACATSSILLLPATPAWFSLRLSLRSLRLCVEFAFPIGSGCAEYGRYCSCLVRPQHQRGVTTAETSRDTHRYWQGLPTRLPLQPVHLGALHRVAQPQRGK